MSGANPKPRPAAGSKWMWLARIGLAAVMLATASCAETEKEALDAEANAEVGKLTSGESLMRVAELTRRGGDVGSALSLYRRAISAEPDNPEPVLAMASLLIEMGAFEEAAKAYRQVIFKNPQNVDAVRGLANVLVAVDRPLEAIPHFRAALEISRDPRGFAGLGVALDMAGKHREAQEIYRSGLKEAPEDPTLLNNLGLSLALTGELDTAIQLLRRAASHPLATPRHRQNLALAYGLAGKPDMAAEIARADLDAGAVRSNLDYYLWLRQRPGVAGPGSPPAAEATAPDAVRTRP